MKTDIHFKLYQNEQNNGCGYTKRKCVELSNGEICGFLDPDDSLLPYAIEHMVNLHLSDHSISIIFSRFYVCDENLNIKKESRRLTLDPGKSYLESGKYAPESFTTFVRSAYFKTEGINAKNLRGIDQDLNFKLEEVGSLYISDKITYLYRQHNNGISSGNRDKAFYWNLNIRHEACLRRGLNPENITYNDFQSYRKKILEEMENKITSSRTYKIGRFIIRPILFIKSILSQKK